MGPIPTTMLLPLLMALTHFASCNVLALITVGDFSITSDM